MAINNHKESLWAAVATICVVLTMLGCLIVWYSGLESRLAITETKIVSVDNSINRVEAKVDKIMDYIITVKRAARD